MSTAEKLKIELENIIARGELPLADPEIVELSQKLDNAMNDEGGVLR